MSFDPGLFDLDRVIFGPVQDVCKQNAVITKDGRKSSRYIDITPAFDNA